MSFQTLTGDKYFERRFKKFHHPWQSAKQFFFFAYNLMEVNFMREWKTSKKNFSLQRKSKSAKEEHTDIRVTRSFIRWEEVTLASFSRSLFVYKHNDIMTEIYILGVEITWTQCKHLLKFGMEILDMHLLFFRFPRGKIRRTMSQRDGSAFLIYFPSPQQLATECHMFLICLVSRALTDGFPWASSR